MELFRGIVRNLGGIRRKLFLSYIAVIVLFLLIASLLTVSVMQNILSRELVELKRNSIAQIKDKFQLITDHILAVSNIYYINPEIYQFLSSNTMPSSYEWHRERLDMEEMFRLYDFAFEWLDYDIMIVGLDGKNYQSFVPYTLELSSTLNDKLQDYAWYQRVMANDGRVVWLKEPILRELIPDTEEDRLYALRQMRSDYTGRVMGILIISVDIGSFRDRLFQGSLSSEESIIILDDVDRHVVSWNYNRVGDNDIIKAELRNRLDREDQGVLIPRDGGYEEVLLWDTLPLPGWHILSQVQPESLFNIIYLSRRFLLISLAVGFLLAGLSAYYMAGVFSAPIRVLHHEMELVKAGDLQIVSQVRSSDEIGELALQFNSLVQKTRDLLNSIVFLSRHRQRAELHALQLQINPHFLYNTIGQLRFMLRLESPEKVEKLLLSLTRIMRHVFAGGFTPVPLFEEISILKEYLSIAENQLSHALNVEYEIEEGILNSYIPRMLLQPVIENAIFHGIKPAGRPGFIRIVGKLDGETITIAVSDNGVGCDPIETESLNRNREGGDDFSGDIRHGIGLHNIRSRLRMRYGERAGLSIASDGRTGTTVTIEFPRIVDLKAMPGESEQIEGFRT